MSRLLTIIFILCLYPHIAAAQPVDNSKLDIVSEPICFSVRNEANYRIYGSIVTAHFMRPDGIKARHRSNFQLAEGQSEEYCTYGPFLPDRQLIFTLRTLFPVFECKTRVDMGEIVIKGERKADDSGVITWAECYQPDGSKTGKPGKK